MHHTLLKRLVADRFKRTLYSLRAVCCDPSLLKLVLRLRDTHLQRNVRHTIGRIIQPVLRACQSPCGMKTRVERRGGGRGEHAEHWHYWRPRFYLLKGTLGPTGGVIFQAYDE